MMSMSIGPFNLLFFAIASTIIYIAGFYFVFKNKLGFLGLLGILLFPLVGSVGVILYSISQKRNAFEK